MLEGGFNGDKHQVTSTAWDDHNAFKISLFGPPLEARNTMSARPARRGHGETIAIVRGSAACPVKAVKAWLAAAGSSEGPLFRPVAKGGRLGAQRLSATAVCEIVKAYAGRLGLKASDFGAHSLRAGFLTSAARRGASVFKMRDVSRHKSMDVLQAYVRDADLFRDHAGAGLL
jgi:hypothetical protein